MFQIGDKAVYPGHGVGIIEAIETKQISGKIQTFFILKILENGMTIMIPHDNVIDDPEAALVLAVVLKGSGQLLGCVGLQKTPDGPELGYWIGREFWGHGYASEAAGRLVRLAFENFALPELIASAVTINDASHRVLEKIGFIIWGTGEIHSRAQNSDLPVIHRRLKRNDWLRATGRAA